MPRLMSVSYTADAVVDRTKTVTRRKGWRMLKAGDRLTLCRKVMGRKPGEPLDRLAEVEVVDVRREQLCRITEADVAAEGVPGMTEVEPSTWVAWYCEEMGVMPYDEVTRIEWRYLDQTDPPRRTP